MHPKAVSANATSRYEVGAQWVVLGQICSEVHLFPLEGFFEVFAPRETELTKVPTFDEVDLPVARGLIDLVRVTSESQLDGTWEQQGISSIVADQKGVFFACEPPSLRWKLYNSIFLNGICVV